MPKNNKNKSASSTRSKAKNKNELLSEIGDLSRAKQQEFIKSYISSSRDPLGDLLNKNKMVPIIMESLTKADHRRILEKFARTNQERYLKALKKDALGSIVGKAQRSASKRSSETKKITINRPARRRTKKSTRQIKRLDSNGSVMTAVDFEDLPDIKSFFFNKDQYADETNGGFMREFRNIHNAEKARSSIVGPSVIKMSIPNLSKLFSEPGIALSVPAAPQMRLISQSIEKELKAIKSSGTGGALKAHDLLKRYFIQSRSDLDTWVRIIVPADDKTKQLQEALEKAERAGNYPSGEELAGRLEKLKGIYSGLDFDGIKTSVQKCKILENEIKISRTRNTSYEFRTAVYVLYKLLNLSKPYIKLQ